MLGLRTLIARILLGAMLVAAASAAAGAPITARFDGRWQIIRGMHDGRLNGVSVRSFHGGDALDIQLTGVGFRIYGVTGPNGGHAVVVLPDRPNQTIDFYTPSKRAHVLVYKSPRFTPGRHAAGLVVVPERDPASRGNYVNIDAVQVVRL